MRDYIHVVDLAVGHVKALQKFNDKPNVYITTPAPQEATAYSMLSRLTKKPAAKQFLMKSSHAAPDIATCYSDATKAK